MSKVLFFCIPAHGHVNPTLALTEELVKNGEQVIYYCAEEFRDKIEKTGAEFRTLNSSYDQRVAGISKNVVSILRLGMEANLELTSRALEEVSRENPDYVIHDLMVFFGRIISLSMGIPTVVSMPVFVLDKLTLREIPPSIKLKMAGMIISGLSDILRLIFIARWYRKHFGIKVSEVFSFKNIYSELNIIYTSLFFQPGSHSYDQRFCFVGPQLNFKREVEDFSTDGLAGKRMIYISLGTAFGRNLKFYFRCFRAFESLDLKVVMSVGSLIDISKLNNIPSNFAVYNHVPQLKVLKHADVFITHGGMNSTAEGILNGVPLIVYPQAADQYLVARRVDQLGAGIYLKRATVKRLRKSVDAIFSNPEFKLQGKVIADSFQKSGGVKAGVQAIIDYKNKVILEDK